MAVFIRSLFPGTGPYPAHVRPRQIKIVITCAVVSLLAPPMHLMFAAVSAFDSLLLVYMPHFLVLLAQLVFGKWYQSTSGQPKAQIFLPMVWNPYRLLVLWDAWRDIFLLQLSMTDEIVATTIVALNMLAWTYKWLFNIMPMVPKYLEGFGDGSASGNLLPAGILLVSTP